ncbi:ribonuclease P protein component [Candidatus Uhrbacteria bacterium]|nr:ribonuclease P protein component [Candidatus Uhrbacteria bacterium]
MLPKLFRLSKKSDFDTVFKQGRRKALRYFFVQWLKNEKNHPRIGIIISNKVSKKATLRNKIKRRIREIVWNMLPSLGSTDVIILAKTGSVNIPYNAIQQDLENILYIIKK